MTSHVNGLIFDTCLACSHHLNNTSSVMLISTGLEAIFKKVDKTKEMTCILVSSINKNGFVKYYFVICSQFWFIFIKAKLTHIPNII